MYKPGLELIRPDAKALLWKRVLALEKLFCDWPSAKERFFCGLELKCERCECRSSRLWHAATEPSVRSKGGKENTVRCKARKIQCGCKAYGEKKKKMYKMKSADFKQLTMLQYVVPNRGKLVQLRATVLSTKIWRQTQRTLHLSYTITSNPQMLISVF